MRLVGLLAAVFLATVLAEIVVFALVAKAVGLPWALGLVLLTSVLGALLVRREGARGFRRMREAIVERRPPAGEATDGLLGIAGAVLLFVPGFVTDAAGLLLLTPPVRGVARRGVRRVTERRVSAAVAGDLFGPRRVRAQRGTATRTASPEPAEPASGPQPAIRGAVVNGDAIDTEVVEGEIIDPPHRT